MAPTVIDEIEILDAGRDGGTGIPAGGDDDRPGPGGSARVPERAYFTAIQLGMAGIIMFFMALTSSFLVRKGLGADWVAFGLPRVLWFNTLILLASSATIELARRSLREGDAASFRHWWSITTAFGVLFLVGQLLAWRQLRAQGVFLSSNPSSSFFYLLTALHGLHLAGGLVFLGCVRLGSWRGSRLSRAGAAGLAALYWHFMDGLWLFLLALLYLGR